MLHRRFAHWIALIPLLACAGCAAAVPYRYGKFQVDPKAEKPTDPNAEAAAEDENTGPQVEFGKPNKVADRVASLVGLPEKIMGLNKKIDNHDVSLDTVTKLRGYLGRNDLDDVAIYVNCYDPREQWRRLRESRTVGAGWRYTFGTLSLVGYTLVPNRIFGGDVYNPFTNSLYVNSDVPAIAMLEAAYAKKIHAQKLPGTYLAMAFFPGVGLVRQCRAVGDVLGYARDQKDWEIEREAYHVLYSQVGTEAGAYAVLVTPVWWAAPAIGAGGAAVGHAAGRMMAAQRIKEVEGNTPKDAEQPAPQDSDQLAAEPLPPATPPATTTDPAEPANSAPPSSGGEGDRLAGLEP